MHRDRGRRERHHKRRGAAGWHRDRCSMMERDIRAVLNGLTLLVDDTKMAGQL